MISKNVRYFIFVANNILSLLAAAQPNTMLKFFIFFNGKYERLSFKTQFDNSKLIALFIFDDSPKETVAMMIYIVV